MVVVKKDATDRGSNDTPSELRTVRRRNLVSAAKRHALPVNAPMTSAFAHAGAVAEFPMPDSAAGLRFSPTLARLEQRAKMLLRSGRGLNDPAFADADAVTAWVGAIGVEIDELKASLDELRREIRASAGGDHLSIPVALEGR